MSTIQDRIDAVERAKQEVRDHPMCLRLEDDGAAFFVIYPCGDFAVQGCRSTYRDGKENALLRLLQVMERHWMESYP